MGAAAVYKFLDAQSRKLGSWATSPLWSVVDGPFRLQGFTSSGQVSLVPNPDYSGSPKATIAQAGRASRSRARPRSTTRSGRVVRARSRSRMSRRNTRRRSRRWRPKAMTSNNAASYSVNYFPLNFNSSAGTAPGGQPVRYIFRQLYFRQAFQHLIDQQGWISAFLDHTANPTYRPDPALAAEPARDDLGDLDQPVPVLGVRSQGPADGQRLEGRPGGNHDLCEARNGRRRLRRGDRGRARGSRSISITRRALSPSRTR